MIDMRLATPDDLPRLSALEEKGFSNPWRQRTLEQAIHHSFQHFFVGVEAEGVIAYALFQLIEDEGELLRISVAPERRRLGIAQMFLAKGLTLMQEKGMSRCYLEVAEGNRPARRLYEALGFSIIGYRRGYYDGEDAVLYQWEGEKQ